MNFVWLFIGGAIGCALARRLSHRPRAARRPRYCVFSLLPLAPFQQDSNRQDQ